MIENWKKITVFIWLFVFSMVELFPQDLEDLSFGDDNSLDVATWNIEWFPKDGQVTVEFVTEIIEQLDLDVLAIQELDKQQQADKAKIAELESKVASLESELAAIKAHLGL